jgi:hypothetical protein
MSDQPDDLASQRPAFLAENHHAHLPSKPPLFGVAALPEAMRGYFENHHGEQWVAMANAQALRVSGGDVGWDVLTVELSSGRTLAMLRDGLMAWNSALAQSPDHWPKMWVLDRSERMWLLAFLEAASARFDRRIEGERG